MKPLTKEDNTIGQRWRWMPLQEAVDVRDGTHDTPAYVVKGIPLVTSKNLTSTGIDFTNTALISLEDHNQIKKRSGVDVGDILFAMIGTIGNPVVVRETREFSIKNVALFKINGGLLTSEFLLRLLNSSIISQQLDAATRGGNQKFVSLGVLRNLRVPVPPLPEQCRIAAILDKADAIRRKREEGIRLTEELLRSTFLEMFGDPVNNPMRWDVVPLGEIIAEGPQNGLYRPSSDYGSGTLIVRIDTFRGGEILTAASINKRVRLDGSTQRLYLLRDDDLLINRVNSRSHLGKTAFVTDLREPVVFESNMMRVSLKVDRANPLFVLTMLGQPALNRQIQTAAKDAVNQSSINQTDVKNFVLPLPPLLLQQQYAAVHEHTIRLREKRAIATLEHETLFAALVQRAFRGEL